MKNLLLLSLLFISCASHPSDNKGFVVYRDTFSYKNKIYVELIDSTNTKHYYSDIESDIIYLNYNIGDTITFNK